MTGVYYAVDGTVVFGYAGYGLDPSVVNGQNAVSCPSYGYEYGTPTFTIPSSADFDFETGGFAIVLVVENVSSGWNSTGLSINENTMTVEGQSVTVSSPATRFTYAIGRASGGTFSLDVAGVTATGSNTQPVPASVVSICPGSGGDVAEVIAVKGALSDADFANVTAYVKAKFGI